jgi:hypothetical protein
MAHRAPPFALPAALPPRLRRVLDYWEGLKRGNNPIPFWDDCDPGDLPDLEPSLLLIDVFALPERFRLARMGGDCRAPNPDDIVGRFLDEIPLGGPFQYLRSQASATVETGAPTLYEHAAAPPYARLLLPMWGDGRIGMILGAVDGR